MLTIVVADSSDREDILVTFISGAKLHTVALRALEIISRFNADTISIMAGINDITSLNRNTRQVRLLFNSALLLILHLI